MTRPSSSGLRIQDGFGYQQDEGGFGKNETQHDGRPIIPKRFSNLEPQSDKCTQHPEHQERIPMHVLGNDRCKRQGDCLEDHYEADNPPLTPAPIVGDVFREVISNFLDQICHAQTIGRGTK